MQAANYKALFAEWVKYVMWSYIPMCDVVFMKLQKALDQLGA